MSNFQFTEEQISNLNMGKRSLASERAQDWAAREDQAEVVTSAILNDEKFKKGEDLGSDKLDELFRNMKLFSANRNLGNPKRKSQVKCKHRVRRNHAEDR